MPLLEVDDLRVQFETEDGVVHAVDGISYSVEAGQALGIVGESGSGKSVSSLTLLGLTRAKNARISGAVRFDGKDLLAMSGEELRAIRGEEIAMIFQDPLTSLHPFYRVGDQLGEAVRAHHKVSKAAAADRAMEMLRMVGIPEPQVASARVPARVLGRHAPAHDDRDGADQRAQAADRRRADDCARRHRPGADPRVDLAAAGRDRHRRGADHPRPRRGRAGHGRDRGHVLGSRHRASADRRSSSPSPSTPTRGACCAPSRG